MQRDDVVASGTITNPADRYSYYHRHFLPSDAVAHYSYYSSPAFPPPHGEQQRQQRHRHQQMQDMVNRHALCLTRIREYTSELESLRRENLALRSINGHLNRYLHRSQLPPLPEGQEIGAAVGQEEDREEEEEEEEESPTSVMDSSVAVHGSGGSHDAVPGARVSLPKSISVRSNAYLSLASGSGNHNHDALCPPLSTQTSPLTGAQKVYVPGREKEEAPLELEVFVQGMFKTELCNKWQETGHCPYGNNCRFAHGLEELRPVIRHPRYKTEVCRMVLAGDLCPYGHRCHFRHALTEQERSIGRRKLRIGASPLKLDR